MKTYRMLFVNSYTLSYNQHFYKQRQIETGKKLSKLNNTPRLNFWQTRPKIDFFCGNLIIWLTAIKKWK